MDPVVVRSSLEWFSRIDRSIEIFLSLAVELGGFASLLNLYSLTFAVLLRHLLLVMREFWLLYEILLRVLNRTQDTLVVN